MNQHCTCCCLPSPTKSLLHCQSENGMAVHTVEELCGTSVDHNLNDFCGLVCMYRNSKFSDSVSFTVLSTS